MLTEISIGFLSTLTYRPDAKRQVCFLPLGGIYWEDEMPGMGFLSEFPEADQNQILRLFGIRVRLWNGVVLTHADQQFWDEMYSQAPHWAFFRRICISADDEQAQEYAWQGGEDIYEAFLADADEVSITVCDGIQHISATWNLDKAQTSLSKKQTWWRRIFRGGSRHSENW